MKTEKDRKLSALFHNNRRERDQWKIKVDKFARIQESRRKKPKKSIID